MYIMKINNFELLNIQNAGKRSENEYFPTDKMLINTTVFTFLAKYLYHTYKLPPKIKIKSGMSIDMLMYWFRNQ